MEIPQPKGSYRVNDSITVTGTAKAFAGNNIDGAKVTYRVTRKTRMPVWWFWGYYARFGGNNEATEISNGELTTDANGSFHIVFKAIPDESVDKKVSPYFITRSMPISPISTAKPAAGKPMWLWPTRLCK